MITLENYKEKLDKNIDWFHISRCQNLSEEFIREFKDKVNWTRISVYQKLSNDFIREFDDRVNWESISVYQKLSEEFIREFQDNLDWDGVTKYQKLSKSFVKEFYIDYNLLNVVHYCGQGNRAIYITKDDPDLINIGCFQGTKEEAIEAISSKYRGKTKKKYIKKVNKCFKDAYYE